MTMKTISHHRPIGAQPVPKHLAPEKLPPLLLSLLPHGHEYIYGQLGSAVPGMSLANSLGTPSLLAGGAT